MSALTRFFSRVSTKRFFSRIPKSKSSISSSNPKVNILKNLNFQGYYFVKRKTLDFWNIQIDLVILYEDHDVTLLDLMRARKIEQKSWPEAQIDYLIETFSSYYAEVQERIGCKILFLNSLNMVYSKAKDSFFLANLQNIITP